MILTAEAGNLPVAIAIVSGLAAVLATLITAFVALGNLKPSRRKTNAEAEKLAADTPFAGGAFVKELSEAASSLVVPLRSENESLRKRVDALQRRVDELELHEEEARAQLHRERDQSDIARKSFDKRLRELTISYQKQIQELKDQIAILEGQIAGTAEAS